MKRTFRKLLALAMLSVLLMVSAFAVYAEEATEEQIAAMQAAGFTDPAFAKALVESGVTPENYSAFTGTIDASNKGITSIAGINKLVSAERIDLTYNEIKDITPIMLEGDFYRGYIDLRYNPINNFPTNYHTRPYVFNFALAQSFSLETGRWFGSSYTGAIPTLKSISTLPWTANTGGTQQTLQNSALMRSCRMLYRHLRLEWLNGYTLLPEGITLILVSALILSKAVVTLRSEFLLSSLHIIVPGTVRLDPVRRTLLSSDMPSMLMHIQRLKKTSQLNSSAD